MVLGSQEWHGAAEQLSMDFVMLLGGLEGWRWGIIGFFPCVLARLLLGLQEPCRGIGGF